MDVWIYTVWKYFNKFYTKVVVMKFLILLIYIESIYWNIIMNFYCWYKYLIKNTKFINNLKKLAFGYLNIKKIFS